MCGWEAGTETLAPGLLELNWLGVQDYAAGCSLAQLVRLQHLLHSEVQKQGWSMEHLEASMHVAHAHSSEPLHSSAAAASASANPADSGKDVGREPSGGKGAHDAAQLRSMEWGRDTSRGVPVLLLHVRGQLGMTLSFDLVTGALCMHSGESQLPGQSFCTVRCPCCCPCEPSDLRSPMFCLAHVVCDWSCCAIRVSVNFPTSLVDYPLFAAFSVEA